ncbi:MAG: phosphate ABC transporter permease subunit PstC [Candidatus Fraserbacteria bacterium RBG_16_55_9]|uniref:Phosphate transport system permease protein n=1 Tax=Fraserbacteria sp. (strain RBG_16_55_9) TaxID=1817864 RepID=A0A1F5UQ51_FRAXR|nr:MAG: phosphate ABC transporter permease subunit PstC [Candidatus Fraserbacteria bacterium RBG_16_55_9]
MLSRALRERLSSQLMQMATLFTILLTLLITLALYLKSKPILDLHPLEQLLFSSSWHPMKGEFGLLPFILGTLWVTGLAMILSVPLCLLSAMYLSEYAAPRIRAWVKPLIDLLAGIPSVVFGVWGVLFVVPLVKDYIVPFTQEYLSFIPSLATTNTTGYSLLAGGVVLAVMVFPFIISVAEEVLCAVPGELRAASLAVGATKWQTIKHVVLRKASPGLIAAVVLGFSRAFGETIAVLMVVGNVARIPTSIFDAAYPLPALIANNYGEMLSVPLYDSALLLAALVLLSVNLVFTILARVVLLGATKRAI